MKLDRILVPLDGSTLAEAALWAAVDLAGKDGATLSLVRAAQVYTLPGADLVDAQVRAIREAEEYLAAVRRRLEAKAVRAIETHVWYGPAPVAIVEAAATQKVDLIVMCTHGRSGLGRLVLGSVAESVLRSTTTPILILRSATAPVETLAGAESARAASSV